MTLRAVGQFAISPGHPCLPGHFPGRPLVPGVLLLEEALALVLPHFPGATLAGLPTVKFSAPVAPGEVVEVLCGDADSGRVGCACQVGDVQVARFAARLAWAT
jgi:3-hydroxyacyl-[acyl-carrier-protein] dehydratase